MKNFFFYDPKLLLYGFLIIFFASYGQTFFISLFNFQIRESINLTNAEFGLIYSIATIMSSIVLIWYGKLIDKIDLRIYTFFTSFGLAASCIAMFYIDYVPYLIIFVLFGLRFFGQGGLGHASQTSMARYYEKNRGNALSFGSFGQPIGEMVLPILVVLLLSLVGWQLTWLFAGLSILIIFIPLYLFLLKDHKKRHKKFLESQKNNYDKKNFNRSDLFKDLKFYVYLPSYLMPPFIVTGLLFYQVHIANEKSWSLELLAVSYVFYGFLSVVGLVIGGPIVDKFKTRNLIPISLLPMLIGIFLLLISDNQIIIILYMSLMSLSCGLAIPFMGSLWAELYGVLNLGSIRAMLHAIGVFSTALSPYLFGVFIDLNMGINFIFIFCLILISLSTILTYIFRNY